jgi:acyl-coenzyme A synthetase/AMP-(fatty) acid ligase
MKFVVTSDAPVAPLSGDWVDAVLLGGDTADACLFFDRPVDRGTLRGLVAERQRRLAAAGLRAGGTIALRLPPSLAFVATLLAAWRQGAQVSLLDHRLTEHEVGRALERVGAQFVVEPTEVAGSRLRGYADVVSVAVTPRPGGRPAETGDALIQFSSGSTGASKVIARTADDLAAEVDRYARLADYPRRGERVVLLASMVHVLGLVGGLLHGLHAGVAVVLPERLTAEGILAAVAASAVPTTVLGVPFHAELLAAAPAGPPLPQLVKMTVAGELVRPGLAGRFTARHGVPLGTMYGMTEVGVIATDLLGHTWPSVAPVHGMQVRAEDGELQIRRPASPYIGLSDPARYADGWLHTKDAATVDPDTGLITILGRLDSQVSIGGLKVDLTEVERTLTGLPEVSEAVVVFDGEIDGYLALTDGSALDAVHAALARELAAYKRPRRLHLLAQLPRTATGKIVRDPTALRQAVGAGPPPPDP